MATACQRHGHDGMTAWQRRGGMAMAWRHGGGMATAWLGNGTTTATAWQRHDGTAAAWQQHGDGHGGMEAAGQHGAWRQQEANSMAVWQHGVWRTAVWRMAAWRMAYGNAMATAWQQHGDGMAHGIGRATAWRMATAWQGLGGMAPSNGCGIIARPPYPIPHGREGEGERGRKKRMEDSHPPSAIPSFCSGGARARPPGLPPRTLFQRARPRRLSSPGGMGGGRGAGVGAQPRRRRMPDA